MPIALIYHDVVPEGQFDASGFPGACAAHYKFLEREFRQHLDAISRVPVRAGSGNRSPSSAPAPCILTFDDGGVSAIRTADLLEEHGWSGQFFVSTDYLDTPGFLTRSDVRALHDRGHTIGSHSCSHPQRMSQCTGRQLDDEWCRSSEMLAEITGAPVTSASVPGGFYSSAVAAAAARAGISLLFTSEPTSHPRAVHGCIVHGRYSIDRGVAVETMAAIAAGEILPRWRQSLVWQAKKVAKVLAGPLYAGIRQRHLQRALSLVEQSEQPAGPTHEVTP